MKDQPDRNPFLAWLIELVTGIIRGVAKDLLVVLIVFSCATAISAGVCWYYDLPIVLSLIGGFITVSLLILVYWDR